MTGLSERWRSAAREGAKGADGSDEELLVPRATGEMTENRDPSSKVTGYTRRTTGEGAGRAGADIVVV